MKVLAILALFCLPALAVEKKKPDQFFYGSVTADYSAIIESCNGGGCDISPLYERNWTMPHWDLGDVLGFVIAAVLAVIGLILAYCLVFWIVYLFTPWGPSYIEYGRVKALSYKQSRTTTGVGSGIGASGQPTTVVTSSYEPEEHNVVFKIDSGGTWKEDSESMFNALDQGDRVELTFRRKKVFGNWCFDLTHWRKI